MMNKANQVHNNANQSVPGSNPSPAPTQPQNNRPLRASYLMVVVGKKNVGKTYTTFHTTIRNYVLGIPGRITPRKALILDANDEYTDVRAISVKDIPRFSNSTVAEVRRIRPIKENGQGQMTLDDLADTLDYILLHYRKGLLLVEDISKFVGDSVNRDLVGAIATVRHREVDVIIHFQTIGKFGHPKIFGNTNYLRMHSISDNVRRHKNKFEEALEPMEMCETLVNYMAKKNNRFYAILDMDSHKISGAFSKADFTEAIIEYISKNTTLIKTEYNKIDMEGKQRHATKSEAIKAVQVKMWDYYGNPN